MRLFIGVPVDVGVCQRIARLQERFRRQVSDERLVKWEKSANLHITLRFLGDTPETETEKIKGAITSASQGLEPFQVALGKPSFFGKKHPRVFVVGVTSGVERMCALERALSTELASLGFEPEQRPYHPHLTFGRARRNRKMRRDEANRLIRNNASVTEEAVVSIDEVVLFESQLSPRGSSYSRLATLDLPGS